MNKRVLYFMVLLVFAASFVAGCAPQATPTPAVVIQTSVVKETQVVVQTQVVQQTSVVEKLVTPTAAPAV